MYLGHSCLEVESDGQRLVPPLKVEESPNQYFDGRYIILK